FSILFLVAAVSNIGIGQRDAIQNENNDNGAVENNDEGNNGAGATTDDAEAILKKNCANCHGDDLTGGMGPDLTKVGSEHSAEEINDIITNGTDGGMPAGVIEGDEKEAVVKWLSEMK